MYALRRVACSAYGVRVEAMAWVSGKMRLTRAYAWFPARWAQRLPWKEAAQGVTPQRHPRDTALRCHAFRRKLTQTRRTRPVSSRGCLMPCMRAQVLSR